eukprot:2659671-Ditylum_brightwellii.AAC.1
MSDSEDEPARTLVLLWISLSNNASSMVVTSDVVNVSSHGKDDAKIFAEWYYIQADPSKRVCALMTMAEGLAYV